MENPYVRKAPSPQQTLDIFEGKWASRFPGSFSALRAGSNALFEDPRIDWACNCLNDLGINLRESSVLELGPLEGAHSYMLSKRGALSVTAIEAHKEAYLKCLVSKELLGMERVNFLLGDGVQFLREIGHTYDVGLACGFLYHMKDPVELIDLLCARVKAVVLWTVYWSQDFATKHPDRPAGSGAVSTVQYKGFDYRLHKHSYGDGFDYGTFFGGPDNFSNWMELEDILAAFKRFGFGKLVYSAHENPNGSALSLVATKG